MTVTITGDVKDVTGVADNDVPWSFASVIRFAEDGSVITDKARVVRAVSGRIKVELEPGFAIVSYGKQVWQVNVPEADTTLKTLIEDAVAFPPDAAQDLLDAAVEQYVETHREQFRTYVEPVTPGDPNTLYQWKDEYGNPVGSPVSLDSIITEAVAQAAATDAANVVTPGIVDNDLAGRQFTWEDAGGGMGYPAVGGIAIGDPRAWPASTVSGLAGRPFDIPESFGVGVGTGGDDAAAFVAGRAANFVLAIRPGKTYRIGANTAAGLILNLGGLISIDAGVTLTFDDVIGAENIPVFTGAGTARSATRRYSLGWYSDGDDLSDAWDACRRAFITDSPHVCIFPHSPNGIGWHHSRPFEFGDPENQACYSFRNTKLLASSDMDQQFLFSPDLKTEDIVFDGKIELSGEGHARDAVLVQGGARIRFLNEVACNGHLRDGVRLETNAAGSHGGIDQFYINFLRAVGYGAGGESGYVLNVIGGYVIQGLKVDHVFANGISVDYDGPAASIGEVNIEGFVLSPQIGLITENSGSVAEGSPGLARFPAAANLVRIAAGNHLSGSYRAPFAVNIGTIYAFKHDYCVLKSENGGPGTVKPNFTVGVVDRYATQSNTDHLADIDFCYNSSVGFGRQVNALNTAVKVGSTATRATLCGVNASAISNVSGIWDGLIVNGTEGIETSVVDDAFVVFTPRQASGILHVKFNTATSGFAIIAWRSDGQAVVMGKSNDVEVRAGDVLTGTFGTDGRAVISIAGGKVYFENRLGSTRNVNAKFL